jgi:hypothetical protein
VTIVCGCWGIRVRNVGRKGVVGAQIDHRLHGHLAGGEGVLHLAHRVPDMWIEAPALQLLQSHVTRSLAHAWCSARPGHRGCRSARSLLGTARQFPTGFIRQSRSNCWRDRASTWRGTTGSVLARRPPLESRISRCDARVCKYDKIVRRLRASERVWWQSTFTEQRHPSTSGESTLYRTIARFACIGDG